MFMFPGGHIPVDGITRRTVIQEISSTARITLFSLASLGSVMGLTFLFINIKYKHKRYATLHHCKLSRIVSWSIVCITSLFYEGTM